MLDIQCEYCGDEVGKDGRCRNCGDSVSLMLSGMRRADKECRATTVCRTLSSESKSAERPTDNREWVQKQKDLYERSKLEIPALTPNQEREKQVSDSRLAFLELDVGSNQSSG